MHIEPTNPLLLHASLRSGTTTGPTALRPPAVTGTPIAARVQVMPEFDSGSVPVRPGAFPMYTRAADRVEAAIQSQLGRTVDVQA